MTRSGTTIALPAGVARPPLGAIRRTVAGSRFEVDHRHDDIEFNLVVTGSGSYAVGELSHALKPGTLIWLLPGQRHHLLRSPRLEMWVVCARAGMLDDEVLAALMAQPSRQLMGHDLLDLDRLLSQVAQDSDEPAVYESGIGYVLQRAVRASRGRPPAPLRAMHPAVARSLLVLRGRGAEISLSELADAASVTAPYLSRLLVEHTGRSFVDWRNRIRLDRFIAAYRPGGNLLEIALQAGFGSYPRFSAVFHELVGCAPSEWVRRADEAGGMEVVPFAPGAELPAAQPPGRRVASGDLPNPRHHWLPLVPWVDAAVNALTRDGFLERLLAARGRPMAPAPAETFDESIAPALRTQLVAGLRQYQPALGDTLARLLELHQMANFCTRNLAPFGLSATRIDHLLTGFLAALWIGVHGAGDPGPHQVHALQEQVEAALGSRLSELGRPVLERMHAALQCHFTILTHAIETARASAEPNSAKLLAEAAAACARAAFGDDLAALDFGAHGLVRRSAEAAGMQPR